MEAEIKIKSGATKWDIRHKVWDYIENKNLANFPRPVHNRIPNFKGAAQACNRLIDLQEFKSSKVVKVNPDRPQEKARYNSLDGAQGACSKVTHLEVFTKTSEVKVDPDKPLEGARLAVLQARKTLLVPTPRLRTGLFNKIVPPPGASKEDLHVCSTSQGVKEFSVPIGLDAKVQVDLVVVGSVAVSEKGYRIGKGEGFADMEYAMMASMGAVNESTTVVTIVHDCQVVDIPEELIESHDLTVDYILTPTRVLKTECKHPKPQGIIWTKLDSDMLEKIPILKKLRALEQKAGKDVTLKKTSVGGEENEGLKQDPKPNPKRNVNRNSDRAPEQSREEDGPDRAPQQGPVTTVYLGDIPAGLRVSELKSKLREKEALPLRLTWQGAQHRAFLEYRDGPATEHALAVLRGLSINDHVLHPVLAKSQRAGPKPNQTKRGSRTTGTMVTAQAKVSNTTNFSGNATTG